MTRVYAKFYEVARISCVSMIQPPLPPTNRPIVGEVGVEAVEVIDELVLRGIDRPAVDAIAIAVHPARHRRERRVRDRAAGGVVLRHRVHRWRVQIDVGMDRFALDEFVGRRPHAANAPAVLEVPRAHVGTRDLIGKRVGDQRPSRCVRRLGLRVATEHREDESDEDALHTHSLAPVLRNPTKHS
jgi:hypothetical protein